MGPTQATCASGRQTAPSRPIDASCERLSELGDRLDRMEGRVMALARRIGTTNDMGSAEIKCPDPSITPVGLSYFLSTKAEDLHNRVSAIDRVLAEIDDTV